MTVNELIEILKKEDGEMPVVIADADFHVVDAVDHIKLRINGQRKACVLLNVE